MDTLLFITLLGVRLLVRVAVRLIALLLITALLLVLAAVILLVARLLITSVGIGRLVTLRSLLAVRRLGLLAVRRGLAGGWIAVALLGGISVRVGRASTRLIGLRCISQVQVWSGVSYVVAGRR